MVWAERAVKICGIRTVDHAMVAAQAGADYIGVILAPSKRQIMPEQAKSIQHVIRQVNQTTKLVGVFVNEQPSMINQLVRDIGLDIVQLSGDETSTIVHEINAPMFKTIRMSKHDAEQAWIMLAQDQPDRVRLHIDAHVAGSYGGAGVVADWEQAQALARELPILLAGGLHPTNVRDAIQTVQPWGVDVSSGIETAGTKDSTKIQTFITNAREAFSKEDQI